MPMPMPTQPPPPTLPTAPCSEQGTSGQLDALAAALNG
jgi:hypothetical protein